MVGFVQYAESLYKWYELYTCLEVLIFNLKMIFKLKMSTSSHSNFHWWNPHQPAASYTNLYRPAKWEN